MKDAVPVEESRNKSSLKRQVLLAIFLSAVVGLSVYFLKPTKIKLEFPYTMKPISETQFSCNSLISTFIHGGNNALEKGVYGELNKGTDKVAIEVEGDKLYFLTRASVEVGTARGEPWNIVKNSNDRIVALYNGLDQMGTDVNLFILNKKNGIAVWTKTNSDLFGTENPGAQSFYLVCR